MNKKLSELCAFAGKLTNLFPAKAQSSLRKDTIF